MIGSVDELVFFIMISFQLQQRNKGHDHLSLVFLPSVLILDDMGKIAFYVIPK